MPTIEHNAVIEMFRENPSLAPHLLTTVLGIGVPPHTSARVADSALDQLIPIEFRADLVLELTGEGGQMVLAIVLESQRERVARKKYAWPVYWAVARAERECPALVLVIAPDGEVAGWAAGKIDLGFGRGVIQPLVLGPATLPQITDPLVAVREVELAILSAMAHGNGPKGLEVVETAIGALATLDHEHAAVYFQIIWSMLREPMQRALEALVMVRQAGSKVEYPPFLQRVFDQGASEGELRGELRGELKGELKGKRSSLLRLLARAGIVLSDGERARVETCTDTTLLDRWTDNVLGAKTAADVFA